MSDTGKWQVVEDAVATTPEEVWEKITSRVNPFPKRVMVITTPTDSTLFNVETKDDE